ncbi:triosephosphate isomerase [Photobacterium gaetbulicola]|uniref:Triosephosphate isomerase n=1 Tax=Photobacterium gaetbulicola TaxID=1295392 RepID=A0A0B9GH28_9GAMM|nr:triose-phosphate isomerase [Photobacterium gaetbulicola]KHT58331.1 triosephosphate isomerase [Photobacterium gaetbulicola]
MKKIWIGSSWKMNKTSSEVTTFCDAITPILEQVPGTIQTFLIPPFPYVREVAEAVDRYGTCVGVQNICWAAQGAFTGEISAGMAKDIGALIVEIGHSERRQMFNETDETVNRKVRAALGTGLKPLVCVGDTAEEKRWGVSAEAIVRQVKIALFGLSKDELHNVIIAYEPVWAIGEQGVPASPYEAENGLYTIRQALIDMFGEDKAQQIILLYGGSVHQDNAAELIAQPSIDGLFVGRAAWDAEGYAELLSIVGCYCE